LQTDDFNARRRPAQQQGLNDGSALVAEAGAMTSRGAKYWNSGTIPLIAPEILGDIIAKVADLAVVIAPDGRILSVLPNPHSKDFHAIQQWEGKPFNSTLTIESKEKFESRLAQFLQDGELIRAPELNHTIADGAWEFPIRYSFHNIGPDGAILMLGRDLRPVAEMQQQLVQAQIALERDYETQREFDTRFRVLMESTREAIVFVSAQTGRITEANALAPKLLAAPKGNLDGRTLADCLAKDQRGDLMERLLSLALSESRLPLRLTLADDETVVRITPTIFRASGARVLLCRVESDDVTSAAADMLADNLKALYQTGPDGMVFTREDGQILSANDGFLDLVDAAHDVKTRGLSFAEFLHRGSVDLKVMTENAARSGRMRLYPTKLSGEFGSPRPVEIAVTALVGGDERLFAFLVRETNRTDAARAPSAPVTDENLRSVMELVGSATLKEIVAETTNVIEQMCIETAIELTMNNRVAAAEMLGLSRQSLYVKLRKYGLLSRED